MSFGIQSDDKKEITHFEVKDNKYLPQGKGDSEISIDSGRDMSESERKRIEMTENMNSKLMK